MRAALLLLALAACADETVSGYAPDGAIYRLETLDGAAFAARATLVFPAPGRVVGEGPCNSYSAAQAAPYPWFELGAITATERACPDLAQEKAFLDALGRMTIAEVSGPALLLTNESGREMTFRADQASRE